MKCDELKTETIVPQGTTITLQMYPKGEVDAAIAELKAENRTLKRALWLARAERAIEKQNHFALCHNHSIDLYFCINGSSMPTERNTTMRLSSEWSMIWKKVARKCKAKAEEYK